jgi:hypothetical protein
LLERYEAGKLIGPIASQLPGLPALSDGQNLEPLTLNLCTFKPLEVVSKPQIRFKGKAQADRESAAYMGM